MSDTELDITSLPARISQLEERQNIVSKYMVGLKRQFDGMTEALQQIERLREQVSELQQRFDQLLFAYAKWFCSYNFMQIVITTIRCHTLLIAR
jgi:uncharacterized coiled-coil protein SlyX